MLIRARRLSPSAAGDAAEIACSTPVFCVSWRFFAQSGLGFHLRVASARLNFQSKSCARERLGERRGALGKERGHVGLVLHREFNCEWHKHDYNLLLVAAALWLMPRGAGL